MTMVRALLSPHRVCLFRPGRPADLRDEQVLSLMAARRSPLAAIRRLELAHYGPIRIDRPRGLVRHPAGHADPWLLFQSDGTWILQLFLHGWPAGRDPGPLVVVGPAGPASAAIALAPGPATAAAQLHSAIAQGPQDHLTLTIASDCGAEVLWQWRGHGTQAVMATIEEDRVAQLAPGEHHLTLPLPHPQPAVLGLIVSARAVTGGIEHKHRLVGDFTLGSGRMVRDGAGALWAPWGDAPALALAPLPALTLAHADQVLGLLERQPAWVQRPHPSLSPPSAGSYGIAHSLWPGQLPGDPRRAAQGRRRLVRPSHPCAVCPVRSVCDQVLPQPATEAEVAPLIDASTGRCRLAAALATHTEATGA